MSIRFDFLPVQGEAILVTITDDNFTMLIDGGSSHPFNSPHFLSLGIDKPVVDSLFVTHIDDDHIGGAISLLKDREFLKNIKQVWFNDIKNNPAKIFELLQLGEQRTSYGQGSTLKEIVNNSDFDHINNISTETDQSFINDKLGTLTDHLSIRFVSPNKSGLNKLYEKWDQKIFKDSRKDREHKTSGKSSFCDETLDFDKLAKDTNKFDSSVPNLSSLAFIMKYKAHRFLFLGDAHINVVCNSLENMGFSEENTLKVDFIKLSHHGSKRNISDRFLSLVQTNSYVICRNKFEKLNYLRHSRRLIR